MHTQIRMINLRYGYFPKTFQLYGDKYKIIKVVGIEELPIGGNEVAVRQFTIEVEGQNEMLVLSNDLAANTWSIITN